MSDAPQGPGWWLASDGRWYPPESHSPSLPPPPPTAYPPPGNSPPSGAYPAPHTTSGRLPAWLVPSHVSGWAVASGYLGLVTFILCGLPGPFALWTGIRGRRQIKRQPDLNGTVRAWVGIVFGSLGTAFLVLIAVAYAIDGLL